MNEASLKVLVAGVLLLAYAALCAGTYWRSRRLGVANFKASGALANDGATQPELVLFATQTGQAEALARQTANWLHAAGRPARVLSMNAVDVDLLQQASRALFIASTYGEGDAPDGASLFVERVMNASTDLSGLRYAVLALGDRQYADFCGFGRALDDWLQRTGAAREYERIDVDNGDPAVLAKWRRQCHGQDLGTPSVRIDAPISEALPWRLAERRLLNPGSAGGPIYHLAFVPPPGVKDGQVDWESGDIVQLQLTTDPRHPREYSISSISSDRELQLLVRQERHPNGTLGAASGLLTSTLSVGDSITLRLRANRGFRLGANADRPLILVGNGTGLAGLRSHLRARADAGQHDNWLVFGERNARCDFLYRTEIEEWLSAGVLKRLDLVYSRDQEEHRYVQHRLLRRSAEVLAWIGNGAAIYVCGSLRGMGTGVDAALWQIVGDGLMHTLTRDGRYRRDVY